MAVINMLPKSISELIAAGEVVENPASVVKETVENSIDAGARHITVEIKQGGIAFIRITDDGCGISSSDVKKAFLRHATSKIKTAADLDRISTLGFRGEALAAISGVSKLEMITKTREECTGSHYIIEGGKELLFEEMGCPDGTTLIISDLFYNTPARMKFLRKDSSEAAAVAAVAERMALSHPEIAFKFIKDGKQMLATTGDGKLINTVYSVLGREFYSTLLEVKGESDGVKVHGYTCKPVNCRASRTYQFTFLNGRLVVSKTVMAAVEQAYKNSVMVGKFPGFVLFVDIPPETVDVNVHPAKTEVRFADEKRIFSAVYYAVKGALSVLDTRPEMPIKKPNDTFFKMSVEEYRQMAVSFEKENKKPADSRLHDSDLPFFLDTKVKEQIKRSSFEGEAPAEKAGAGVDTAKNTAAYTPADTFKKAPKADVKETEQSKAADPANNTEEYTTEGAVKLVGEAFSTYILAERDGELYLIDKHAAHERMIFNRLKKSAEPAAQVLLTPVSIRLSADEYSAAVKNTDLLYKAGFEIEDFGERTVLVRAIPAPLDKTDITACVTEAVSTLVNGTQVNTSALDDILHTVACKAAIKAGYITSSEEKTALARSVLSDKEVMYCPHGRPVAYLIKKSTLDKYFGRIQ